MSSGGLAPRGKSYVLERPHPPGRDSGPPVYITAPGYDLREGVYTPKLAIARRWSHRIAAHRYRNRRSELWDWKVVAR